MEENAETLDDIMAEFEDDEQEMYENESEGEYEEIDDFDPEFSIFGSDKVVEKKESVLGKRVRSDGLTCQ